jgi:hypothetical protein
VCSDRPTRFHPEVAAVAAAAVVAVALAPAPALLRVARKPCSLASLPAMTSLGAQGDAVRPRHTRVRVCVCMNVRVCVEGVERGSTNNKAPSESAEGRGPRGQIPSDQQELREKDSGGTQRLEPHCFPLPAHSLLRVVPSLPLHVGLCGAAGHQPRSFSSAALPRQQSEPKEAAGTGKERERGRGRGELWGAGTRVAATPAQIRLLLVPLYPCAHCPLAACCRIRFLLFAASATQPFATHSTTAAITQRE